MPWNEKMASNPEGNCWGQCLQWLNLRRSGKKKAELDFTDSLDLYEKSTSSQRGISYSETKRNCSTSERHRSHADDEFLDGLDWSGKYKIVVIVNNDRVTRHALALYSPWFGPYELFDPNKGVFSSRTWSEVRDAVKERFHYSVYNSYWFLESVLTVPESFLKQCR